MRIKNFLKTFFLLLFLFKIQEKAQASHLFGAEFTYEYIGPSGNPTNPFRYKIVYKIYTGNINIAKNVNFRFYQKNGTSINVTSPQNMSSSKIPTSTVGPLALPVPAGCVVSNLPTLHLWIYDYNVDLPLSFDGYYATASIAARNADIDNLQSPGSRDLFSYMEIPSPLIQSKAPVFTDTAVVVMFAGDTTTIINSAFDVDGDKLIYAFNQPFELGSTASFIPSATVPPRIPYATNYSLTQPFGPGGYASIQASTGLAKYYVPLPGNYVVSFQVKEYRNINGIDVQIGSTIRDIQLVVRQAPANSNTKPTFTTNATQTITITEGQAIPPLTFTFTDPNPGQALKITASSPLLDGPGNKNATFNSSVSGPVVINNAPSGTTATFNYTSVCGEANLYPLDITVWDGICGTTPYSNSYTIQVLPYDGPQQIFGDTTVCNTSLETYSITGKATASYNWRLSGGGTILGNKNNDSIRVQWATPGRYKLTAIETSTGSCTDSISFFVNVEPGIALTLNASATAVCVGTPVTLTAAGGTNYSWTDGTNTYTGASVTVTPATTTTFTVSGTGITGCSGANSITINVNPLPNVDAGSNRNVCLGSSATLTATGASTYTWTNGVNSFTGNNISVTPTSTTTYTVTGTNNSGCINSDQVTLTVVPAPVPNLNAIPEVLCKNAPAVALPANSTIDGVATSSFNPANLSAGNHTLIVSETNAQGCTGTATKTLTVNALPTPAFTNLNASYCQNAGSVTLSSTLSGSSFTIDGVAATVLNPATLAVGNHTVVVSNTNTQGCTGTATQTVQIKAIPTANFGALANAYCKNSPAFSLNISGSTFTVDGTAASSFDPATLAVGNHTVSVVTTNADGCSVTGSRTVEVFAIPVPDVTAIPNQLCKNATAITLPANSTVDGVAATSLNPATLSTGNHTVTVSETNAQGCTGSSSKTVTINALPTPDFGTLANAYCKDAAAVALNGAGSVYQIDGVTATTFNPATLTVGNHTVSVTTTNAQGCSQTATRTVAVNALPTPSLAFLANAYCKNDAAVTLTSGTGISYTIDGTTATTFNPATLTVGNHTVVITETNSSNCTASTTKTVTVNTLPAPAFTNLNASYCQNAGSVTLSSTLTGSTFTIDGAAATVLNPATLSVGNHTVVVSNTNTEGCTGTATQTVQIKAIPTANFGSLANGYCKNDLAFSLNIPGSTFTVDGTAATSFDPATLTVGNHTVSVVTTNADGCSVTSTRTVAVYAIPTPSLAFLNNSYCQNAAAVTLTAGTGISYTIDGVAATSLNPSALTVGNHTVAITEVNANNCTVTTSRSITINPAPLTDAISGPVSICPGLSGVKYRILNPRETNYQWSISASHGTIVAGQGTTEITVNWNGAASATVSAQGVNTLGCTGPSFSLPVTINPILITQQPTGQTSICKNQANNVMYVMQNPTIGSSFSWTVTGGSVASSNVKGDTVYINWTNVGANSIVVQESSTGSVNCFGNSAPFAVTILPSPNPALTISGPSDICLNTATNFTIAGAANSTYAWTVTENGNTTPLSGTSGTVSFTATAAGSYTLSVIETNANGCVGTPITKTFTVEPTPSVSQISGPAIICPENLSNQVYLVQGPAGYTYNWQVSGGTMVNPGSTNNIIQVNFDNNPSKQITVTPVSALGCVGTPISLNVSLDGATLELANISTGNSDDKVVELNLQMLRNTANTKSINVYRREAGTTNFNRVAVLPNTTTTFTDNSAQTTTASYEYYLESQNECGTVLSSTTHQTMLLKVASDENAKTVTLNWNAYKGWNVSRYEIYAKADNGNFELLANQNLGANDTTVVLTNIASRGFNQCFRIKAISADTRVSWSNAACVDFVNELKFYNVITPNNDGYNDNFVIENINLYPGNELSIFNRWGTEVYRKTDYDNSWNAKDQKAGTYYFLLKMKDGRSFKNWVEVVK